MAFSVIGTQARINNVIFSIIVFATFTFLAITGRIDLSSNDCGGHGGGGCGASGGF